MRRILRDPALPGRLLFLGMVLAGFAAIVVGWNETRRTPYVPYQLPAVVSGGLGGLVLVVSGATLAAVQSGRRTAALERAETEDLLDTAAALLRTYQERQR